MTTNLEKSSINFPQLTYAVADGWAVLKVPLDPNYVLAYIPTPLYQNMTDEYNKTVVQYHRHVYLQSLIKGCHFKPEDICRQPINGSKCLVMNEDVSRITMGVGKKLVEVTKEYYNSYIYAPSGAKKFKNIDSVPPPTPTKVVPQLSFTVPKSMVVTMTTTKPKKNGLSFNTQLPVFATSSASNLQIVQPQTYVVLPEAPKVFNPAVAVLTSNMDSLIENKDIEEIISDKEDIPNFSPIISKKGVEETSISIGELSEIEEYFSSDEE